VENNGLIGNRRRRWTTKVRIFSPAFGRVHHSQFGLHAVFVNIPIQHGHGRWQSANSRA